MCSTTRGPAIWPSFVTWQTRIAWDLAMSVVLRGRSPQFEKVLVIPGAVHDGVDEHHFVRYLIEDEVLANHEPPKRGAAPGEHGCSAFRIAGQRAAPLLQLVNDAPRRLRVVQSNIIEDANQVASRAER